MGDLTSYLLVGKQSCRLEDVRVVAQKIRRWFERRGIKEEVFRPNQKKAIGLEEGEEEGILDFDGEEEEMGENGEEEQNNGEEENQMGDEEQDEGAGEEEEGSEETPDLDGDEEGEEEQASPVLVLESKPKKVIPSNPKSKSPYIKTVNCLSLDPKSDILVHVYGESDHGTAGCLNLQTREITPISHPIGSKIIKRALHYENKIVYVCYGSLYIHNTTSGALFTIRTGINQADEYTIAGKYHNPFLDGSMLYIITYNENLWRVDLNDPKLLAHRFSTESFTQALPLEGRIIGVHNEGTIRSLDPGDGQVIKETILTKKKDYSVMFIRLKNHLLLAWTVAETAKYESTETKFMLVRPKDFKIVSTITVDTELHREDREWHSDLIQDLHPFVRRGKCFIFHIHQFGRMGLLFRRGPKLHNVLGTTQAIRGDRIVGSLLHAGRQILLVSQYGVYQDGFKPSIVQFKLNW